MDGKAAGVGVCTDEAAQNIDGEVNTDELAGKSDDFVELGAWTADVEGIVTDAGGFCDVKGDTCTESGCSDAGKLGS